jgi:hypothetical protein
MAKMMGESAYCCMLYGGKIIIEGGSSLCTHPLQKKSSYRRGRLGVWQAEIIVEGGSSLCTPLLNSSSSLRVRTHTAAECPISIGCVRLGFGRYHVFLLLICCSLLLLSLASAFLGAHLFLRFPVLYLHRTYIVHTSM